MTPPDFEDWDGDVVLTISVPGRCFLCGAPAGRLSVSFEGPVCSPACLREAWRRVFGDDPVPGP